MNSPIRVSILLCVANPLSLPAPMFASVFLFDVIKETSDSIFNVFVAFSIRQWFVDAFWYHCIYFLCRRTV